MVEIRTRALLLNSAPIRESDQMLILFTEELGKVRALAKGALRSKKRFLGALLNLNELAIELAPARGKEIEFRLELADIIKSRYGLARDPVRLACAYALAELAERAAPDLQPSFELYRLLEKSLDTICTVKNYREYFIYFLFKILEDLGYLPSLENCAVCGKPLGEKPKTYRFSIGRGGFICESCARGEKPLLSISPSLAQSLRAMNRLSFKQAGRIRISEKDWVAAIDLIFKFAAWHLERPLLSLGFLRDFKKEK